MAPPSVLSGEPTPEGRLENLKGFIGESCDEGLKFDGDLFAALSDKTCVEQTRFANSFLWVALTTYGDCICEAL